MKRSKLIIMAASVVSVVALTLGGAAPAQAAPEAIAVGTSVSVGSSQAVNWYGCAGLAGARVWQVAAFTLGYCPSVWFLQATPMGRAFTNAIVNGACRVPWIVRAATLGRFSTC